MTSEEMDYAAAELLHCEQHLNTDNSNKAVAAPNQHLLGNGSNNNSLKNNSKNHHLKHMDPQL